MSREEMETRGQLRHQQVHPMGSGSICSECHYTVVKREIQDLLGRLQEPSITDDEDAVIRDRIDVLARLAVEVA